MNNTNYDVVISVAKEYAEEVSKLADIVCKAAYSGGSGSMEDFLIKNIPDYGKSAAYFSIADSDDHYLGILALIFLKDKSCDIINEVFNNVSRAFLSGCSFDTETNTLIINYYGYDMFEFFDKLVSKDERLVSVVSHKVSEEYDDEGEDEEDWDEYEDYEEEEDWGRED